MASSSNKTGGSTKDILTQSGTDKEIKEANERLNKWMDALLPRYNQEKHWRKKHDKDIASFGHVFDVEHKKIPQRSDNPLTQEDLAIKSDLAKKVKKIEDRVLKAFEKMLKMDQKKAAEYFDSAEYKNAHAFLKIMVGMLDAIYNDPVLKQYANPKHPKELGNLVKWAMESLNFLPFKITIEQPRQIETMRTEVMADPDLQTVVRSRTGGSAQPQQEDNKANKEKEVSQPIVEVDHSFDLEELMNTRETTQIAERASEQKKKNDIHDLKLDLDQILTKHQNEMKSLEPEISTEIDLIEKKFNEAKQAISVFKREKLDKCPIPKIEYEKIQLEQLKTQAATELTQIDSSLNQWLTNDRLKLLCNSVVTKIAEAKAQWNTQRSDPAFKQRLDDLNNKIARLHTYFLNKPDIKKELLEKLAKPHDELRGMIIGAKHNLSVSQQQRRISPGGR